MAVKAYNARIRNADGVEEDIHFQHVNFNGNLQQAREFYEKGHDGVTILSLEELGYVSPTDVKNLAAALEGKPEALDENGRIPIPERFIPASEVGNATRDQAAEPKPAQT